MLRIIRHADLAEAGKLRPAVAIGNFDGVHLGHQTVLRALREQADALGTKAAVLTFAPHPRRYFNPQSPPMALYGLRQKARVLASHGVDLLCILRFDHRMAQMDAGQFVSVILQETVKARHVITGSNFVFGSRRGGSSATLEEAAGSGLFGYSAIAPLLCPSQEICSSSRIRESLARGEVKAASALLGRDYAIEGRVRAGDGRGKELGFPTLNLSPGRLFLPAFGVYAARVEIEGTGLPPLPAVVNLGVRPTFGGSQPVIEAHLLEGGRDYYGEHARIFMHQLLRPEQRFDSAEALRRQIALDCEQARLLLSSQDI